MFRKHSADGYLPAAPGILRKTLVHGASTLMTEFRLDAGAVLPRHAHPHEQTGTLVSGHMRLTIGDTEHDVQPGDSWCIAGDVEHEAQAIAASIAHGRRVSAVEVFAPVREDYLPDTKVRPSPA